MGESVSGEATLNLAERMKCKAMKGVECDNPNCLPYTITFFVKALRYFSNEFLVS